MANESFILKDGLTGPDLVLGGGASSSSSSAGSGADLSVRGHSYEERYNTGNDGSRQGSSETDTNPTPQPGDRGYTENPNPDGSKIPNTDFSGNHTIDHMPLWQPNPELSPEENINGLQSYLSSLFSNVLSYGRGGDSLYSYRATLELMYDAINKSRALGGLSDEASITLAEKVSDHMTKH